MFCVLPKFTSHNERKFSRKANANFTIFPRAAESRSCYQRDCLLARLQPPQPGANTHEDTERNLQGDLRRIYRTLNDEKLGLLTPGIRVRQFGRGEILIREGESGDCFYVLRDGQVEVLTTKTDGTGKKHVKYADESSLERPSLARRTFPPENLVTPQFVLRLTSKC